jgi:hypothetical protein
VVAGVTTGFSCPSTACVFPCSAAVLRTRTTSIRAAGQRPFLTVRGRTAAAGVVAYKSSTTERIIAQSIDSDIRSETIQRLVPASFFGARALGHAALVGPPSSGATRAA